MTAPTSAPAATHAAPLLSWIVPMFGTSDSIPELLRRIEAAAVACGLPSEVVLVDDADPGFDPVAVPDIVATRLDVRILRLACNLGQDGALREGLRAGRGQWALLLDADLQDPPEAIAQLWNAREPQGDGVFASREGRYESGVRLLTSRIYRRSVEILGGLPRGACLFVLLRRPMIDAIVATSSHPISLLAVLSAKGSRFRSVPVQRATRARGSSSYSSVARMRKALVSLWQIVLSRHLGRAL
jgi:polyisoprenyl-phosphate glycosyltransferase